jgi:hypothetical protein
MKRAGRRALAVLAALAGGCSGADPYQGATAYLRVADAQFYRGTPPDPTPTAGPEIRGLSAGNNRVLPGLAASAFSGRVVDTASSVLINLPGDIGYWVVPTGVIDPSEEGQRDFSAKVGFSRDIGPGKHDVLVRALDPQGHVGKPDSFTYVVLDDVPQGALVVALDWDADADLDLHVVMPNPTPTAMDPTVEVWAKNISSRRGGVPDGGADDRALLDFDSNAQCVIDGRRQENVVIKQAPPAGHYVVRVDTAGLCAVSSARWHVRVLRDGNLIGEGRGIATPYDGYPAQGKGLTFGKDQQAGTAGAGVLAVEFNL